MLEVKVTLEIPGVPEALSRLADAIASRDLGCKSGKAMDAINKRLTAAMNAAEVEPAPAAQIPVQPAPAQTAIAPTPSPAAPVQAAAPAPTPAPAAQTPAAPVQTPAVQPMPAQAPAGVAPQPAPAPTPTASAAPAPAPAAKKYTRDEIAKAGSVLASQGKIPELLALLNKYGVQSVVQLDPGKYDAFANDLRALGAAL